MSNDSDRDALAAWLAPLSGAGWNPDEAAAGILHLLSKRGRLRIDKITDVTDFQKACAQHYLDTVARAEAAEEQLANRLRTLDEMTRELDEARTALLTNGFVYTAGAEIAWRPPVNEAAGANWRKLLAAEKERDAAIAKIETVAGAMVDSDRQRLDMRDERDAAIARAEKAERERSEAIQRLIQVERNHVISADGTTLAVYREMRDAAIARAEKAEREATGLCDQNVDLCRAIESIEAEAARLRGAHAQVATLLEKHTDDYALSARRIALSSAALAGDDQTVGDSA